MLASTFRITDGPPNKKRIVSVLRAGSDKTEEQIDSVPWILVPMLVEDLDAVAPVWVYPVMVVCPKSLSMCVCATRLLTGRGARDKTCAGVIMLFRAWFVLCPILVITIIVKVPVRVATGVKVVLCVLTAFAPN